jgi:hypothetical protein
MKSPIVVTSENFVKEDKFNNKIFLRIFYNEQKEKLSGNLHLNLVKEKRNRFIGTYHYPEKTLYVKRSSTKHLFRKSKSYGFNYTLIASNDLEIDYIHLTVDDDTNYLIPKSFLNNYGSFLTFKEQGFEVQKFYPVALLKPYNLKPKKDRPDDDSDYEDKWEQPLL